MNRRQIWNWHLWLGVAVLAPLVFWLATALVSTIWPIETVRGKSLSAGQSRRPAPLQRWMSPPSEALEGAVGVTLRIVEDHPVALVDRGDGTEVWELSEKRRLGPVLPLSCAREASRSSRPDTCASSRAGSAEALGPRVFGLRFQSNGIRPEGLCAPPTWLWPGGELRDCPAPEDEPAS